MAEYLQKSPHARSGREAFGGILFHRRTGISVALDRPAFRLFELSDRRRSRSETVAQIEREFKETEYRFDEQDTQRVIAALVETRMLKPLDRPARAAVAAGRPLQKIKSEPAEASSWPNAPCLTAQETVHWAITYRCNLNCP